MDLEQVFEKFEKDYIKFEDITNPKSKRPDLHAFLMLEELAPSTGDIVSAAEHDIIYLDVDLKALAANATEDHIRDLVRCGVNYDSEYDCLSMFV